MVSFRGIRIVLRFRTYYIKVSLRVKGLGMGKGRPDGIIVHGLAD